MCQHLILYLRLLGIHLYMECNTYLKISHKNVLIWSKYMCVCVMCCVCVCYVFCVCVYLELKSEAVFKTWTKKTLVCLSQGRISHHWRCLEFLVMVMMKGRLTPGQPHCCSSLHFPQTMNPVMAPPQDRPPPLPCLQHLPAPTFPFCRVLAPVCIPPAGERTTFSSSPCLIWSLGPRHN